MRLNETAGEGWLWKAAGCGGCALVALYLLGLLLGAAIGPYRALGQAVQCQGNLMRIARGCRMYADDYDDRLPVATGWMDRVVTYVDKPSEAERRLHCPTAARPGEQRYGYALDSAVAGKPRSDIADPSAAAMVYDSTDLARSAVATVASLPNPGRHVARVGQGKRTRRVDFVGAVSGTVQGRPEPAPPAR